MDGSMIIEGNIITAEDGMTLTNGATYSKHVYLGKWDSPENWWEISDADVPAPEDEPTIEDKAEGFDILMGVSE